MAHEREGARITMPYFLAAPWIVLETDATAKILEKNARMKECPDRYWKMEPIVIRIM